MRHVFAFRVSFAVVLYLRVTNSTPGITYVRMSLSAVPICVGMTRHLRFNEDVHVFATSLQQVERPAFIPLISIFSCSCSNWKPAADGDIRFPTRSQIFTILTRQDDRLINGRNMLKFVLQDIPTVKVLMDTKCSSDDCNKPHDSANRLVHSDSDSDSNEDMFTRIGIVFNYFITGNGQSLCWVLALLGRRHGRWPRIPFRRVRAHQGSFSWSSLPVAADAAVSNIRQARECKNLTPNTPDHDCGMTASEAPTGHRRRSCASVMARPMSHRRAGRSYTGNGVLCPPRSVSSRIWGNADLSGQRIAVHSSRAG